MTEDNKVVLLSKEKKPGVIAAPRVIWRCNCGSAFFWLFSDQTIECVDCGAKQSRNHFDPREST